MRAAGAGVDEAFLAKLKVALAHYGVSDLEYNETLEIVVLRMFASQATPDIRFDLMGALLTRMLGPGPDIDDLMQEVLFRVFSRLHKVHPPDALPGFVTCAPGNVVSMIAPVSVCHHVSTIGQRFLPICS